MSLVAASIVLWLAAWWLNARIAAPRPVDGAPAARQAGSGEKAQAASKSPAVSMPRKEFSSENSWPAPCRRIPPRAHGAIPIRPSTRRSIQPISPTSEAAAMAAANSAAQIWIVWP